MSLQTSKTISNLEVCEVTNKRKENTEGAKINGKSRETGNRMYIRRKKQNKHTTQYV